MPICQSCDHHWSWKTTFKKAFSFKRRMKCPNCKEVQYASTKSMRKSGIIGLFPAPIIIFSSMVLKLNLGVTILVAILILMVITITYPNTLELSNEEEPLW
ncbi:TIGR04104 family putative zinc finger protein [Paenisporosarcina indica]|uniref:TIGR04104 family putative zinc finger protein n=1 Tax=Paenisporosarcina indica TaxID=650093 RepID=UPI00094F5892|nr:TIGR04104 family putative zinc finger protein [Paenisporosarcina indica]